MIQLKDSTIREFVQSNRLNNYSPTFLSFPIFVQYVPCIYLLNYMIHFIFRTFCYILSRMLFFSPMFYFLKSNLNFLIYN